MRTSDGVWRRMTNLRMMLVAASFIGVGLLLLWWSGGDASPQRSAFAGQLGGLLVATGLLSVFWELVGRRGLVKEVHDVVRLNEEVVDAGIVRVPHRFYEDTPWGDLFRDAQEVDIFVAYARAWRNQHQAELAAVAKRGHLRVFLPDPDDPATVARLQARFNYPEAADGVRQAVEWFRKLGPSVEVYFHQGDGLFTCYRFGSTAVLALYTHGTDSHMDVPTFVARDGALHRFIEGEIQAISAVSRIAP